jgi:putative SOS response-associated peptidase YedK
MCGRYSLVGSDDSVAQAMEALLEARFAPSWNVSPTQFAPVVRATEAGRRIAMLRWGLVPPWAEDLRVGSRMINARAETAARLPAFRAALRSRRCLVPTDGFYEWRTEEDRRVPYRFRPVAGGVFALAGLWERWSGAGSAPVESFTILTTAANESVRPYHDRMPAILDRPAWDRWLDPSFTDPRALTDMLRPYAGCLAIEPLDPRAADAARPPSPKELPGLF